MFICRYRETLSIVPYPYHYPIIHQLILVPVYFKLYSIYLVRLLDNNCGVWTVDYLWVSTDQVYLVTSTLQLFPFSSPLIIQCKPNIYSTDNMLSVSAQYRVLDLLTIAMELDLNKQELIPGTPNP